MACSSRLLRCSHQVSNLSEWILGLSIFLGSDAMLTALAVITSGMLGTLKSITSASSAATAGIRILRPVFLRLAAWAT